jgi:hypothetical protein
MQFKGGGDKRKLFDALPNIAFQRKEAVEIAKQFDLSARTVDNFLKTSLGKTLDSPKTGFYKKL